jgi:peroxiredoxin
MRAFIAMFAAVVSIAGVPAVASARDEIATGANVASVFAAKDSTSRIRSLSSIAGKKGTVIVFFRSARWCPYCQAQLKRLKDARAPLAQRGYALAALSYDSPATLAAFAAKTGVGYTLLSDEKSAMIDAFGLRDPAYGRDSFAYGVPKASIMIFDQRGTLRWKSVAVDYKIRPDNADILKAVDALHGGLQSRP